MELTSINLLLTGVVLAGAIALAARAFFKRKAGGGRHQKSPVAQLRERFERGEISKDEFEKKRKHLKCIG